MTDMAVLTLLGHGNCTRSVSSVLRVRKHALDKLVWDFGVHGAVPSHGTVDDDQVLQDRFTLALLARKKRLETVSQPFSYRGEDSLTIADAAEWMRRVLVKTSSPPPDKSTGKRDSGTLSSGHIPASKRSCWTTVTI
jgi:hypothetical protein